MAMAGAMTFVFIAFGPILSEVLVWKEVPRNVNAQSGRLL